MHSERTPEGERGAPRRLHRLQLWVALPPAPERPVRMWWNFVASERERIAERAALWEAGGFDPIAGETTRVAAPPWRSIGRSNALFPLSLGTGRRLTWPGSSVEALIEVFVFDGRPKNADPGRGRASEACGAGLPSRFGRIDSLPRNPGAADPRGPGRLAA